MSLWGILQVLALISSWESSLNRHMSAMSSFYTGAGDPNQVFMLVLSAFIHGAISLALVILRQNLII